MTIALPQPLVLESPMSQLWCTSELLPSNCDEIPLQALKRTTSPFCLEIMYGHLSSFGKWIVRSDRYQFQAEPLCCLQQCSIRNFISLHQIWTEILHKCVMFIWCKGGVNFVVSNHWTFEAIGYCHLIYMNLTKQYVPLLEWYLYWPTDHGMLSTYWELTLSGTWTVFVFLVSIDELGMVIISPYSTLNTGTSSFSPWKWCEMTIKHVFLV